MARIVNSDFETVTTFTIAVNNGNYIDQDLPTGQYFVEIISEADESSYLYPYVLLLTNNTLSIDETAKSRISIFPNPTSSKIYVDTEEIYGTIEVYNIVGKKIISTQFSKELDFRSLNAGTYIVRFINADKTVVEKIIKL